MTRWMISYQWKEEEWSRELEMIPLHFHKQVLEIAKRFLNERNIIKFQTIRWNYQFQLRVQHRKIWIPILIPNFLSHLLHLQSRDLKQSWSILNGKSKWTCFSTLDWFNWWFMLVDKLCKDIKIKQILDRYHQTFDWTFSQWCHLAISHCQ